MAASFLSRLTRFAFVAAAAAGLSACGVNSIPTAEENAKAKWADVQNQYQRRADLIPNLVATVKGYAKQEQDTLTKVTEARAKATSVQISAADVTDPAKMAQYQAAQGQLSAGLGRLLASVEAYPDLKSNQNFLALQSQLEGTENRIAVARRDYNEAVQAYNTTIRTFPAVIGAKVIYGAKPMVPFQATTPGADTAPTVSFDSPAAPAAAPANDNAAAPASQAAGQ
ncbi:LemA family protein [Novosphingobium olei]|uniref:LemA family protein n=1 Tax=Novosphingobium olei TaxID=2728851 RepID=A0A7Y0G8Q5_9SPHN|nr:LemA family protein [Novosphingobium olei]NML92079.1 LemA family protein [Novosphingobium olei]BEV02055.1 LemA family protein [Novosphingobium olei]